MIAVRVRIEGQVQMVWFRAWTIAEAGNRGLKGWVRNRADGSVEALFAGPEDAVKEMVAACWQGPPKAEVSAVAEIAVPDPDRDPEVPSQGFDQRPTV